MAAPVFVFQRGLFGVRGPIKNETDQLALIDLKVEQMFTTDNTTTSKTVKIYAPFRLNAAQRMVMANGKLLNIAAPSGRQQGDYLYSATVTLVREDAAVYTTAPSWASVEIR
jgi:hypothetical protein